jgi:hypothetical protein
MHKTLTMVSLALLLVLALLTFMPQPKTASAQTYGTLEIDGDVNMPMNLTYAELSSLPMVSEVAKLQCVEGWYVTYNWTGVPLFYLLTLAEIRPDAYKVVTSCSDGYTSDLLVQDALNPTTILALEANGTSLPQLTYGPEGPYRLVVPGKYGYKWSSGIEEITVVTTDYKGTWESSGFNDVADVSNYGPMPTPSPPVQTLNVTYGNRTFEVGAFTDASLTVSSFDASLKTLNMDVTVPLGTLGFADLILQQNFLNRPYNVTLDGKPVSPIEADTNTSSYLYLAFQEGSHTMSISAAEFQDIPEAIVYYPASVGVGQNATFDASKSVDVGRIVSYEWGFGDGTNGTGPIVTHSYSKAGTYQVTVNVTNNQGISDLQTFTITVGSGINILLLSKVLLAAMLVALILIFVLLLAKRRKLNRPDKENSHDVLSEKKQVLSCTTYYGACGLLPFDRKRVSARTR